MEDWRQKGTPLPEGFPATMPPSWDQALVTTEDLWNYIIALHRAHDQWWPTPDTCNHRECQTLIPLYNKFPDEDHPLDGAHARQHRSQPDDIPMTEFDAAVTERVRKWREAHNLPIHENCRYCGTGSGDGASWHAEPPLTPYDPIALPDSHGRSVRGRFISDEEYHRTGAPQTHAEVVSARIAAYPRAVQAVRNALTTVRVSREDPVLSEKDILRLAVELVK